MTASQAELVVQSLMSGLLIGCVYGLLCLGLGLIFGVMRVVNFAQGEFMMLGMYGTMALATAAAASLGAGVAPYPAAIFGAVATGTFAAIVQRWLLAPVSKVRVGQRSESHNAQLIVTLGLSLVIQNVVLIALGSESVAVRTPLSAAAWEIALTSDASVFLNKARMISALIAVLVGMLTYVCLQILPMGRELRAAADNAEAATYCGINVDRAHRVAFAIGAGLTALAGGLLAANYPFNPYVGLEFIVIMYTGVVLGGMGSIAGAFWGGMCIGFVQQTAGLILPIQLQNTAIFLVFFIVVMFRPQGLFGRNVDRA